MNPELEASIENLLSTDVQRRRRQLISDKLVINLLNDEETFTDVNGCQIIAFNDYDLDDVLGTVVDAIEDALDSGEYSNVASFEYIDGILTIHIHDESGVVVVVNDER